MLSFAALPGSEVAGAKATAAPRLQFLRRGQGHRSADSSLLAQQRRKLDEQMRRRRMSKQSISTQQAAIEYRRQQADVLHNETWSVADSPFVAELYGGTRFAPSRALLPAQPSWRRE